jgi:hypothetical protein
MANSGMGGYLVFGCHIASSIFSFLCSAFGGFVAEMHCSFWAKFTQISLMNIGLGQED